MRNHVRPSPSARTVERGRDARPAVSPQSGCVPVGVHAVGAAHGAGECPGRHGHDSRHGEGPVGGRASRRHGHHHSRRSGLHAFIGDARGRDVRLHAHPHRHLRDRRRIPGLQKGSAARHHRQHPADGGGRLRPPDWRRRRGGRGHGGRAAAPDGHRHGRRDAELRRHRKPPDQRPRLHHPRAPQRRRRAAAARRARAADVFRQRRQAGAEQLPARRDRQQHEQRGLPERRGLHRQAAGGRRRRDQDHDELVQRRVRPRRRRGAEHDAQVGDEQAARERLGVPPQRRDERQRLLRQPRQHQEGRVPVEPVRVHGGRTDHRLEDVLVRRLRGERHPAGAHVGQDGSDRGPARERLHELLGSHHPAERHGRRRRARAHLPARHGLRSRRRRASCRPDRSIRSRACVATRGRLRARRVRGQPHSGEPDRSERPAADAALPGAQPARVEQQLRGQPDQHGRHARVRHPRRSQLQQQRSLLRALQLLGQPQGAAVPVRGRWRRRRVRRRRREGARERLRGEPHARALVDADQRGAVRPQPRAHEPAAARRRRHERPAGALRHSGRAAAARQRRPPADAYRGTFRSSATPAGS